ncbi:MAG: Fic family protein [Candidatus Marinimicrobia bacterium]|nr:Fic family protein [Candidatus Neomarinimicrobiota bacterium]MCF7829409.1 Fic family protein [Candidatus Neomarinimicrobiota bacterium]MCF7880895.1 Fic family protein [Candidatus Neomarinimicrobiota bacterium]
MTFNPETPYNELPPLPPAIDIETRSVLKNAISANRALAELKGAGDLIPNQAILINAIPLQEAKSSSEIENIVTTNDKLFKAAVSKDMDIDPQTKEVLNYRTALRKGHELLKDRPLSTNLLETVCGTILDKDAMIRKAPGTVIENRSTNEVVYTPPVGEDIIRTKLGELEKFMNTDDDLDHLVRLAMIHYQFEAIHPFYYGNGRTGRILNLLYLLQRGLLNIPVLYLSRFIIQNKVDYYSKLRAVTEADAWEEWILFMLQAVEETALWTSGKIREIKTLLDDTVERCREELPSNIYSKELVELIFVQPYCKIAFVVEAGIAKRQTASEYLQALVDIGILTVEPVGREKIYIHPELLNILTDV